MTGWTGGSTYERGVLYAYLRMAPVFARCSDEQLAEIEAVARFEQCRPGTSIVREGDPGDDFFVIMSGKARVERSGRDVAVLGPGDYFGELALFDPAPRNATVVTDEGATAVVLTRDAFQALLGASAGLRDEVLRGMAHRLHELDAKV